MQDSRHQEMELKSFHLESIKLYIIQQYADIFDQMIQTYQNTFIPISLSLIAIIILIWTLWVPLQVKEMQQQLNTIKLIGEIITMNDIRNN